MHSVQRLQKQKFAWEQKTATIDELPETENAIIDTAQWTKFGSKFDS